jgi:long-chain fatty acid transport protein
MKRSLVVMALVLFCAPLTFATLVTNMNQSALYFRLLSRNASTDVDAAFYNPAGTVQLKDGWHLSLSNQTIFQEKKVLNDFPLLNTREFDGKVDVPFFPDFYAIYKTGKLALSFGFGPNSGGGTADFSKGLPSFEEPYANFLPLMAYLGIPTTGYSVDIAFKGQSTYWGFQLNAAYELADWLDAAVGARLIVAHNSYTGSITNFELNPMGTGLINASQFFSYLYGLYGSPFDFLAAVAADKSVDAAQNGTAVTPLLSLNFHPLDGLNLAVKYEFVTKLHLTNDTTTDDLGLFPNGVKFEADIPAILSLGAEYRPASIPRFMLTASFNYFFDKQAIWENNDQNNISSDSWDLGAGVEYGVTEALALSVGYLHTQYNLLPAFNSDFRHEMPNNSFGFGGRYKISPVLDIDLSGLFTLYDKNQKTIDYTLVLPGLVSIPIGSATEQYKRTNFCFAVGFNFHVI